MRIGFVTSSDNKVEEIQTTLGTGFDLAKLTADIDEFQPVNILDPTNLITKKLRKAQALFPDEDHIIVEDTSLCIDALFGLPGLNIKQWLEAPKYWYGTEDIDPKLAPNLIYNMARGAQMHGELAATATVFVGHAYCDQISIVKGSISGHLLPAGDNGWGFDRILAVEYEGETKRLGDFGLEIKSQISHRALGAKALKQHLSANY